MSQVVEEIKKGNLIGRVVLDEEPMSPRSEFDNMGVMVCFHGRYDLGDKTGLNSKDFSSWNEVEEYLKKEKDAVVILPLYLYDHSGLRMKVGSFRGLLPQGHAEFDSGQVGFIYVSRETVKKEYGDLSKESIEKATKHLEGEVETYDQYLRGEVYAWHIVRKTKCSQCGDENEETIDSCYGYYGDEEDVMNELKSALESHADKGK